ncbi:MAG: 16S rRNA (cytosine(1402)-N(4))-methyltransferase [Planctomycetes bacterium GWF2_40_8]|nr:MAG: 16S rRNA (cytosine(1402)-N(4))-methyltransferase [Planctomycetes bacterium GWF2_40_8]OHB90698.1 MAG: 16S rRNA (cytosine(1402)-N(4))-methyltransferase [Planctomycetes bacterium RIFCSPHIGHO2_02_FULL_40_12]OHC02117.1 MAG: 16S rRNA (cytosine(1402)-N(4))-methyltransferase [Planctomycetes bacterium RIFCSPLOWO2_12_FULL_40_19]
MPHKSVMLDEVISFIKPGKGDIIVDATIGAGGHSCEILKMIGPDGLLIGIDKDAEILKIAGKSLSKISDIYKLYQADYVDLDYILDKLEISKVQGILLDLGVSSLQLDSLERGFSFSKEGPLDMRMDRTKGITAEDLLKRLSEKEMADIFWRYGGEGRSRRIAKAIIQERRRGTEIKTTTQLAKIVEKALYTPGKYQKKRKIHPATRVFQALRIAVNDELKSLEYFLNNVCEFLASGSRIVVISFHSLEDRLVKSAFRKWQDASSLKILTKKPLSPLDSEIRENVRARSAKLRAAERT